MRHQVRHLFAIEAFAGRSHRCLVDGHEARVLADEVMFDCGSDDIDSNLFFARTAPQLVEMEFDEFMISVLGPGLFETAPAAGGDASCRLRAEAFIALCAIGSGHAVLVADADLLHESLWDTDQDAAPEEADTIRFLDLLIESQTVGEEEK